MNTIIRKSLQNCPTVWPGVNARLHWSFEDPAQFEGSEQEKLTKFREVRALIEERFRQWVLEQYIFADY